MGTGWVDVKRAEGTHRSRLVVTEVNNCSAPEPLAAVPPIEMSNCLLRQAAQGLSMSSMHLDVTLAYSCAEASRDVDAQVLVEARSGTRCRAELAKEVHPDGPRVGLRRR